MSRKKEENIDLSERQARVGLEIIKGSTYEEISAAVGVGVETVRDIVNQLRDVSGCRRKVLLAFWLQDHTSLLKKKIARANA